MKKEKTNRLNLSFPYPCYCCVWNGGTDKDEPCSQCVENIGIAAIKSYFDPILEPE